MRLTSEQTKRIMECIAREMGVELGDRILIENGHGGMAEVIVYRDWETYLKNQK